ncbi:hypothetical protein JZ751_020543 [Albula glossodonta]|uniref:Uncharacterized protein n=1 Tax=Albula glossodonta TaxID=121402 RepID=A0A8T2PIW3_9TELE|nr:hypothetical protein JZ751_020543 [Albula glossodonta]
MKSKQLEIQNVGQKQEKTAGNGIILPPPPSFTNSTAAQHIVQLWVGSASACQAPYRHGLVSEALWLTLSLPLSYSLRQHGQALIRVSLNVNQDNVVKVGHRQVVNMIRQGGNQLVIKVVTVSRNMDPEDTALCGTATPQAGDGMADRPSPVMRKCVCAVPLARGACSPCQMTAALWTRFKAGGSPSPLSWLGSERRRREGGGLRRPELCLPSFPTSSAEAPCLSPSHLSLLLTPTSKEGTNYGFVHAFKIYDL